MKVISHTVSSIIENSQLDWPYSENFLFIDSPLILSDYISDGLLLHSEYYCCGLITKGNCSLDIAGKKFSFDNHCFLISRPGEPLVIHPDQIKSSGLFIFFNEKFIDGFNGNFSNIFKQTFLSKKFGNLIKLTTTDHNILKELYGRIFDLLPILSKERWEITAKKLVAVLINETDIVLKRYHNKDQVVSFREAAIAEQFANIVAKSFKFDRNVSGYAERLNITPNYLYKAIKHQLGRSPASVINSVLLSEAEYLILTSEFSITQIADHLNFSDVHSFSKFFKRYNGKSPTNFKVSRKE